MFNNIKKMGFWVLVDMKMLTRSEFLSESPTINRNNQKKCNSGKLQYFLFVTYCFLYQLKTDKISL